MANPLLLDIVTFLTDNGIVEEDGVDAFRDFTPEAPDSLIVLNEYKGDEVVPYEDCVNRSIQIVTRDKDADLARQKALAIFELLKSDNLIVHFTEDRWGQVHLRQTPFKLKQDNNERVYYAFNAGITTTID